MNRINIRDSTFEEIITDDSKEFIW